MALKLNILADELSKVREAIAAVEEELAPLKIHEAALRDEMLEELRAKKIGTVRSEITGETYVKAIRFSFPVKDAEKARAFAEKNDAFKTSIDTVKITKLLRDPNGPMPEEVGFESITTEFLQIRKGDD